MRGRFGLAFEIAATGVGRVGLAPDPGLTSEWLTADAL
jgi:hypothetical protein